MTGVLYLDHNATTPVATEVAHAMWPHLTTEFGNPSSATPHGRRARAAVDRAREQVATLIGAAPDEIVFTGGGTEANNLAIRGAAAVASVRVAVTSAIEHPATVAPLAHLHAEHGWQVHEQPVDAEARVLLDAFPDGPIGVGTLILAHNEIGTLEPVAEFSTRVQAAGGVAHADAAQAVGKVPVLVNELGVDLLSIAGHKLYAPKGVGALYVRRGTSIAPVVRGAGQERGLRPGTENVAAIVGLGAAAELAGGLLAAEGVRQTALRELLWDRLAAGIPGLIRVTPREETLPNTLMVAVPDMIGADILEAATSVAASTGSACHAGVHTPSGALLAIGLAPEAALGALRLSVGRSTTESEIEGAAVALAGAAALQRG